MSITTIWLILTFCILAVIACYGFSVIIGDGQNILVQSQALFGWLCVVLGLAYLSIS